VVLAVAATMLVAGVVVAGAHDGRPTKKVIHACVDDQTDAIQIVGGNDTCGAGESPLDWNGKGPRGAQGLPGPAGETGFEHLTVVTASKTVAIAVGSTAESLLGVGDGVGVGVVCPGDSSRPERRLRCEPTQAEPPPGRHDLQHRWSHLAPREEQHLDVAESSDLPTGWFAMVSDSDLHGGGTAAGVRHRSSTVTVHVWAVCTDEGVI
jgi:hypothetical protein